MGCELLSWVPTEHSRLANHLFSLKILSPVPILSWELVTPQSNLKKQRGSWGDLLVSSHPTAVHMWGKFNISYNICWLKLG